MKILIWTLTFLAITILNELLGAITGIKLGYLLVWLPIWFISSKLCKAWENRNEVAVEGAPNDFKETEPKHSVMPPPSNGWTCICGNVNPSYTSTCVCGKNKREVLQAQFNAGSGDKKSEDVTLVKIDEPNSDAVAERIVVTVDRSNETVTCPNCNRTQGSNRTFCYNCNAIFEETKSPFVVEEMPPVAERMVPIAQEIRQTKFCRKCGFELIEDSKFCSKCGMAVVKEG